MHRRKKVPEILVHKPQRLLLVLDPATLGAPPAEHIAAYPASAAQPTSPGALPAATMSAC